ncbi:MAG: membrane integrity-associated transporter subunit PqiC [Deltaproteobacteria bacterium]|nr:membrane integrity-associated transporter subunit PqiC [Deltaproteobacteria bacterium]
MHRSFSFLKILAFIILCLWPFGCATSPPTQFYLLSPLPAPSLETGDTQNQQPTTIRVDAVTIPGYLDRDEIVTRVNENEIHLADLNQWGESLRGSLTTILALNLSRLLPTKDFAIFPFKCPSPVDYQLSVEIVRMDGSLDGDVHLTAQWSILEGKAGSIMVTRKSRFKASKAPTGYSELVAAQSRLVEALSREIAESIQSNL